MEIDLFDLTNFFGLDLFNFSDPHCEQVNKNFREIGIKKESRLIILHFFPIVVCTNGSTWNNICKAAPGLTAANCDCHEVKSPFSFTDRLNGINESLLFLMGTCILYMGLLILIEVSTIIRCLKISYKCFREIAFLAVSNFFPVQKLILGQFRNCKKWNLGKKNS